MTARTDGSLPVLELLAWDSALFGVSIARVHPERLHGLSMEDVVAGADARLVDCLYLSADAGDVPLICEAEEAGFRTYDVRVELQRRLDGPQATPKGVRRARDTDSASLEEIARERFCQTRFFSDPHFSPGKSATLYVEWVRRGLAGFPARQVWVPQATNGFIVVRLDAEERSGTIELVAVASDAEGRGVGATLMAAADAVFASAGLESSLVVTQGRNVTAQRLYQHRGYRTVATRLWLHRWRRVSVSH